MRRMLFALPLLLLAGCATTSSPEPLVSIQKETVAVAVHCRPDLGKEPDYPDTTAALTAVPHPDAATRLRANPADPVALTDALSNFAYQAKLLLAGRLMRIQRDREKTAALEGCKGAVQ